LFVRQSRNGVKRAMAKSGTGTRVWGRGTRGREIGTRRHVNSGTRGQELGDAEFLRDVRKFIKSKLARPAKLYLAREGKAIALIAKVSSRCFR